MIITSGLLNEPMNWVSLMITKVIISQEAMGSLTLTTMLEGIEDTQINKK